tara:strand:- start:32599 stop:36207 length:3609 start_codon:yes stop_codon:yes gene_type:complete
MGFSEAFEKLRRISNTLGLGIPDKIDELFMPKTPAKEGLKLQREGSAKPIPVIYGTQFVGGIVVHKYVTDSVPWSTKTGPNRFLHLIVVFCEGYVDAVEELYFNNVKSTDKRFDDKNGDDWFVASIFEGAPDQGGTLPIASIPNWTDEHRLNGLCYAYIGLQQDKNQTIWSGEPKITARIRGKHVYDPRTNTTQYSDNPALCLRDYLTNSIYGAGLPESRIDDAKIIAAANNCDTVIDQVKSTVTRSYYDDELKQYVTLPPEVSFTDVTKHTCNLTIDTNEKVFENTKIILNTFRGLLPPAYVLGPIVEEAGSPTFTFDDSNIVSDVVIKSPNLNQRFNRVTVRFPNETSPTYDEDEAFYPASDSAIYQQFLDEDNGKKLEKVFDFNGINNMAEAQQMAEFLCKKSRFQIATTIEALPVSGQVGIGDIVGLTNDDNGYNNKPFRVKSRTILSNGNYRFELLEHENNIYPWEDKEYTEVDGGTWLGDPGDVDAPTGLNFEGDKSLSSAGTLSWDENSNLFVRNYIVEMLKVADETGTPLPNEVEILKSDTVSSYFNVPIQVKGTYRFNVYTKTTVGNISLPATIDITFQNPDIPDFITVDPGNFDAEVRAGYNTDKGVGTNFQFSLNDTLNPSPPGGSVTFVKLNPDTMYTVFGRSVNAYGVSAWASQQFTTTKDGTGIIEVIGDDVSQVILPDVITAVENDLQQIVTDSLVDYPTRTEVSNEISSSIGLVNSAFNENPRISVVDTVHNMIDNYETEGNVKTEELERKTQFNLLETNINENVARLTTVETAVSDLDSATAARFTTVETQVNNNAASIVNVELSVSDLDSSTSQQFAQIQASVDNNSANITTVSTALATEETTRATQVAQLQATSNATISRLDSVESDTDGNTSSISSIQSVLNNPTTGLSATYGLAQSADNKATGNASSITVLSNKVEDENTGLSATFSLASLAKVTADNAASSVAGLTTRVEDTEGVANSALTLSSSLDDSLDGYRASAQLSVDTNGNAGFIQLDATPSVSQIKFQAGQISFLNPQGQQVVYFNTSTQKYVFDGTVYAKDIEGDVVDKFVRQISPVTFGSSFVEAEVSHITISSQAFGVWIDVSPIAITLSRIASRPDSVISVYVKSPSGSTVHTESFLVGEFDIRVMSQPMTFFVPAGTSGRYSVYVANGNLNGTDITTDCLTQILQKQVYTSFKAGGSLS